MDFNQLIKGLAFVVKGFQPRIFFCSAYSYERSLVPHQQIAYLLSNSYKMIVVKSGEEFNQHFIPKKKKRLPGEWKNPSDDQIEICIA